MYRNCYLWQKKEFSQKHDFPELYNFDSEIVHTHTWKLNPFQIWKTIKKKFAALFIQLWNFRVFLFLTFFAKSNNKVTRRDYVNWGTLSKLAPNTKIPRFDGTYLLLEFITLIGKYGTYIQVQYHLPYGIGAGTGKFLSIF